MALLSLGAFPVTLRLELRTDVGEFTAGTTREQAYYEQTRKLFGTDAFSFVYVQSPSLFTAKGVALVDELADRLSRVKNVEQVDSAFTVTEFVSEGDSLKVAPLMDWPPADDEAASKLLQRALAIPMVPDSMLSRSGDAMLLRLRLNDGAAGEEEENAWLRRLFADTEDVLEPFRENFEETFQFGFPAIVHYQVRCIVRDAIVLMPCAGIVLVCLLLSLTGSLSAALLPLLTSAVSTLWTLAAMAALGIPINVLTYVVPGLILVMGSTEDIHLLAEYRAQRRRGHSRDASISRMAVLLGKPVLFTSLTTLAGFLCTTVAPVNIIREFGLASAIGLFLNPLVTFALLPAYLRVAGAKPLASLGRRAGNRDGRRNLTRLLMRLHRRPLACLAGTVLPCLVLALYGVPRMVPDNNTMGYFREGAQMVRMARTVEARMAGTQIFQIRVDGGQAGAFFEPANLAVLQQMARALAGGGFDHTDSLADQLAYVHCSLSGTPEGQLPPSRQAVAEYLLFIHPADAEALVSPDGQQALIHVRHRFHSSRELNERLRDAGLELDRRVPATMAWNATGALLEVNRVVEEIVMGQCRSLALIVLLVAVAFGVLFRSLATALVALVPNLAPVGLMFGVMHVLDMPLNTATSTVAAVCLGIAVDDTIHLMFRYRRNLRRGASRQDACFEAVHHEVVPVVATSVALGLCFLTLGLSNFRPICHFGILASVIMGAALVMDLVVTPIVMVRTRILQTGRPPHAQ